MEDPQDVQEVVVSYSFCAHGPQTIGVNYLLAERTRGEVWALRDVENLCEGGFAHCAAVDGPEATEDSEEA